MQFINILNINAVIRVLKGYYILYDIIYQIYILPMPQKNSDISQSVLVVRINVLPFNSNVNLV